MAVETKYGDTLVLRSGQEVTIEVQKDGNTVSVIFKEIGEDGEMEGDEITVGTMPKAIPLTIREKRSGELLIVDGANVAFKSTNSGDDWEEI